MTRAEFIQAIVPACKECDAKYGIPWRWLVCQAIQESGGYGLSDLSVNAHNLYGIKGKDYFQGKVGYAKFSSWDEAIMFQGWQLNQSRYVGLKALVLDGRYKDYGDALQLAGWCARSKPTYGQMIAEIAEDYKTLLDALDTSYTLSAAQQWATEQGIIDLPDSIRTQEDVTAHFARPVDYNTLAWAIYKARGKVG